MELDQYFSLNETPFRILLADVNEDDQFFFEDVSTKFKFNKQVKLFEEGGKLLTYLLHENRSLPDVLFLDYNMPRKHDAEWLLKIKQHPTLKDFLAIIYSICLHNNTADSLHNQRLVVLYVKQMVNLWKKYCIRFLHT